MPGIANARFQARAARTADRDKAEFLKDVCAFANADGGDLIYGIDEEDGKASALTPITGRLTPRRVAWVKS